MCFASQIGTNMPIIKVGLIFGFFNEKKKSERFLQFLTWKNDFESQNFSGKITLMENVQKKFQLYFFDQRSIGFMLKRFYQITLT